MRFQSSTRSSLFLIELIIAILFFSLGSAVCVQAFVKAHTVTAAAQDLSFASSTCSSAASVVKYAGDGLEQLREYFPSACEDGGDGYAVYYDGAFAPCDASEAAYTLYIHTQDGGDVRNASIRMDGSGGDTLYALELRYPLPQLTGEVSHG